MTLRELISRIPSHAGALPELQRRAPMLEAAVELAEEVSKKDGAGYNFDDHTWIDHICTLGDAFRNAKEQSDDAK
jgi:hypothetical protein